jgi:hypothetical protein
MKASAFEQRHAMLLRQCIYGAAFCVYFVDRDDVVWRFIRDSPSRWTLEHAAFTVATLLIGVGAYLCTQADAPSPDKEASRQVGDSDSFQRNSSARLFGEWLYAAGLSTLAPLWGCVLLIVGESLRIAREAGDARPAMAADRIEMMHPKWGTALRRQAAKWGVLLTMVAFTVTLIDRVADYGILVSVVVWALLNLNEASIFTKRASAGV